MKFTSVKTHFLMEYFPVHMSHLVISFIWHFLQCNLFTLRDFVHIVWLFIVFLIFPLSTPQFKCVLESHIWDWSTQIKRTFLWEMHQVAMFFVCSCCFVGFLGGETFKLLVTAVNMMSWFFKNNTFFFYIPLVFVLRFVMFAIITVYNHYNYKFHYSLLKMLFLQKKKNAIA